MNPKWKLGLIIGSSIFGVILIIVSTVLITIAVTPKDTSELDLQREQYETTISDLKSQLNSQKVITERFDKLDSTTTIIAKRQEQNLRQIKPKYDEKRNILAVTPFDSTSRRIANRYAK